MRPKLGISCLSISVMFNGQLPLIIQTAFAYAFSKYAADVFLNIMFLPLMSYHEGHKGQMPILVLAPGTEN